MLVRSLIVTGMASLLGALLTLSIPLHLDSVDRVGNPIPCGHGFHPRYDVAREQDAINLAQHLNRGPAFVASDYTGQCAARQTQLRSFAVPVGVVGVVMMLVAVGLVLRSKRHAVRGHRQAGRHRAWAITTDPHRFPA